MFRGISLANKCLLLFGAAVVLIIVAALTVPWLRMNTIADDQALDTCREMVRVWEATVRSEAEAGRSGAREVNLEGARIAALSAEEVAAAREDNPFVGRAWDAFIADPKRGELIESHWRSWLRLHEFARAVRGADGSLQGVLILERRSPEAGRMGLINSVYLLAAGSVALGLAVLTFYLITNKLVLGPVRSLRGTADQVREGNLDIRSQIATGDEFEDLAETFNAMLVALQEGQRNLRAINNALDARVGELEAQNVLLDEANRVKGEFLANVSHELRTPLNSILGFADLLIEIAEREAAAGDDSSRLQKRRRYLENIVSAGKSLLDLINGLLDIAKVEAGKMDVQCEPMDLANMGEGLMALMRPVADKRGVELRFEIAPDTPVVRTDPKKLQQVVFNLLSNAVKFTGEVAEKLAEDRAVQSAERAMTGQDPPSADDQRQPIVNLRIEPLLVREPGSGTALDKVRISVLDTGPGIAPEHQAIIFEKFTQLDAGYNRKHSGTGLGLAICKELTHLLQGEIQVESALGRGAMFSVIIPVAIDPARINETKLEAKFRVSLSGRRAAS